jgi:hypothetical protein
MFLFKKPIVSNIGGAHMEKLIGRRTILISTYKDRGVKKAKFLISDENGRCFGIIKPF